MSISAKLLSMHSFSALVILMATFVVISLAGFFVAKRFMKGKFEPSHNTIVGYMFGTVGVIYAVLLGFAIFLVWQQYEESELYAAIEAGDALAIYRDLSLYPDLDRTRPARESLALYITYVINEEYPAMRQMKRSKATDEAFNHLWTKLGELNPRDLREQTLYGQILADMRNMGTSRTERLQAADDELPDMIWLALILGAAATLGGTFFFSPDHVKAHLALTCLLAALMGTVWFVIMGLDHPFLGWACIKPGYFESALESIRQGFYLK